MSRAQDVLADVTGLHGLGDRRLEDVGLVGVLAADVDERPVDLRRPRRDQDPLDQLVRVLLHQFAVLERPRLGLVGVAHEVLVHVAVREEGDLPAHREAGAATAPDVRVGEVGEHLLGRHRERLAQHLVAAAALVDRERVQARLVDVLEQQLFHSLGSSFSALSAGGWSDPEATPGSALAR